MPLLILPARRPPPRLRRPGCGELWVRCVLKKSVVTRAVADSPLRLLTPRNCGGDAAWAFASTLGGGLVCGDAIQVSADVGPDAVCVLATQASTKVYRSVDGVCSRQQLHLNLSPGSLCCVLPDPVTCFAGAVFEQGVDVTMSQSASLVLVDSGTSGRQACGERWAMRRYVSRIGVTVEDREILRDALLLDQAHGPIDAEHRMGGCGCFATLLLLGPRVCQVAGELLEWATAQPARGTDAIMFSASPLADGAILRVAGPDAQATVGWIRQRLKFVKELLGTDPWARKW